MALYLPKLLTLKEDVKERFESTKFFVKSVKYKYAYDENGRPTDNIVGTSFIVQFPRTDPDFPNEELSIVSDRILDNLQEVINQDCLIAIDSVSVWNQNGWLHATIHGDVTLASEVHE